MLVPEWQQHSQRVTYTRDRFETIAALFAPLEGEKIPALALHNLPCILPRNEPPIYIRMTVKHNNNYAYESKLNILGDHAQLDDELFQPRERLHCRCHSQGACDCIAVAVY